MFLKGKAGLSLADEAEEEDSLRAAAAERLPRAVLATLRALRGFKSPSG